jgi:hypothetical protein
MTYQMFGWFKKKIVPRQKSTTASSKSDPEAVAKLEQLVDNPAKGLGANLVPLANRISELDFIGIVRYPTLVGRSVIKGELGRADRRPRESISNRTSLFSAAQVRAMIESPEIEQTVFILRRDEYIQRSVNTRSITIGRSKETDVKIADFAISRSHAEIQRDATNYSIRDNGSRNGTKVNGKTVGASFVPIRDGDVIALGRYEFLFLTPEGLYKRVTAVGRIK